ncbi:hypothetical protein [Flexithrix dorotheae]|uniref:hypothetical protein n=1 Tax=Flexithrix dorotheae TaxID=70993 RepID=UPI000362332D|nr:hypothetical protein [Flexithrix dorotheae]
MKKIILLLVSFLFMHQLAQAQAPQWTDYYKRKSAYPENLFLTGFSSQGNVADGNKELFDVLSEVARKQLIESIQVSIKSVAEINIQNINSKTLEQFKQSSVSLAQANIVGLKYETYYDKKNKEAYAFTYARISEVIDYYKNTISSNIDKINQKVTAAEQAIAGDDKQAALKAYFECNPLFLEIEEAQFILLALKETSENAIQSNRVNELDLKVKEGKSKLLNSKQLTLDDVGYFMAYGLFLQTDKLDGAIVLNPITYQDTELESELSGVFDKVFEQNLVNVSKYQIISPGGAGAVYSISGTYWEQADYIQVISNLKEVKSGKTIASAEGILPFSWVETNKVDYIPSSIKKAEFIDYLELKAQETKMEGKVNQDLKSPIVINAIFSGTSATNQLANLPIKFSFLGEGDKEIGITKTDRNGVGRFFAGKITSDKKMQIIQAELDVATYLGIDITSRYYQKVVQEHRIPSTKIFLNVSGLLMYITSNETNGGRKLTIPYLEPSLKQVLSDNGFAFTDDMSKADYAIDIQANARNGSSYDGIYFSFADATVSVTDLTTGNEEYKGSFKDVKGGGANYDRAGIAALKKISDQISKDMLNELKKS